MSPRHLASAAAALVGLVAASCSSNRPIATPSTPATTAATTVTPTSEPASTAPITSVPTGSLPATTATVTTLTPASTTTAPTPAQCIAALPVGVKVAQLVWPAVYGNELAKRTADFAGWGVGGAVLMTWPDEATPQQLAALKAGGSIPLLVATDEEGGNVQRLARLGVMPAPATVAATMTADAAEHMVATHATVVKAVGVDIVFAPVVDVSPTTGTGPIGNRAFSRDPAVVARYAAAYVAGWESAGILPVLKHFPGHGSASGDTHQLIAGTPPLATLRTRDLVPYERLAGTGAGVMVGHLDVPGLTDQEGVPASLSKAAITDLLRGEYGYADALVFTDALGMRAISDQFDVDEAAVRAIVAGADVVIFTSTDATPVVIEALESAAGSGRLPASRLDDAVGRVLRTKGVDPCALPVD